MEAVNARAKIQTQISRAQEQNCVLSLFKGKYKLISSTGLQVPGGLRPCMFLLKEVSPYLSPNVLIYQSDSNSQPFWQKGQVLLWDSNAWWYEVELRPDASSGESYKYRWSFTGLPATHLPLCSLVPNKPGPLPISGLDSTDIANSWKITHSIHCTTVQNKLLFRLQL